MKNLLTYINFKSLFHYLKNKIKNTDFIEKKDQRINELEEELERTKKDKETAFSLALEAENSKLSLEKKIINFENKYNNPIIKKISELSEINKKTLQIFIPKFRSPDYKVEIKLSHPSQQKDNIYNGFLKKTTRIRFVKGIRGGWIKNTKKSEIKEISKEKIVGVYSNEGLGHVFEIITTAGNIEEQFYIANRIAKECGLKINLRNNKF